MNSPAIRVSIPGTLIASGAVWRYLDDGSDQGTAWRATAFNDSAWKLGPAQLGYGEGDEATVISYGPSDTNKHITVLDRSRVPFDVINVLVSLLGRIIFDFNMWNRARQEFPMLIVFEEAHTYLSEASRSQAARKTVERIAKEGRKYGVSCMIVSQRPAEISETITAQCNNFIAMRLLNPNDQPMSATARQLRSPGRTRYARASTRGEKTG